jgi:XTP/dITP diphosphohydrolase
VRSARWAGEHATTDEITRHTLAQLEGATDRSATFRTVVALISPSGEERFFEGEVRGRILEVAKVPPQPKMPYSPIFLPDERDKVWAEMSMEKQNEISHRGQAFRKARAFLETL